MKRPRPLRLFRAPAPFAVLCGLLLAAPLACDDDATGVGQGAADAAVTGTGPCTVGQTACVGGRLRACLEDETGWLETLCDPGSVCTDGECRARVCAPGLRECADEGVRVCAEDGQAWSAVTPCEAEQSCIDGVCLGFLCEPGEVACGEGVTLTCGGDGLSWGRKPCGSNEVCIDGACGPPQGGGCEPGRALCAETELFTCVDGAWSVTECADGEVCFALRCVECVQAADCGDGACIEGRCEAAPPEILTERLPAGQIGQPYAVELTASGGTPPYTWALAAGPLPAQLSLGADTGVIDGTPREIETFPITVSLTDAEGLETQRDFDLTILARGLQVATEDLPVAEEGEAYEFALEAVGGQQPYGWFLVDGALPMGVVLGGDGVLRGAPSEVGQFDLRVRVVDAATPPGFAEADLTFEVAVAPLRIVADQILDLFIAKVVTLPTITIIPGIPVPYDTQLTARGGLRPLTWAETEVIPELRALLAGAGIPEGLVLEPNGRLHGGVASLDEQVEIQIPFTQIVLTGFIFFGEVRDSQGVPDTDSALFLLPTLPIGG